MVLEKHHKPKRERLADNDKPQTQFWTLNLRLSVESANKNFFKNMNEFIVRKTFKCNINFTFFLPFFLYSVALVRRQTENWGEEWEVMTYSIARLGLGMQ